MGNNDTIKDNPSRRMEKSFLSLAKRSETQFNNSYSECPSLRKNGLGITSFVAHFTFVCPVSNTTNSTFLPFIVAPSRKVTLSCYISAFLSWVSSLQTTDHLHLPLPPPSPLGHRVPEIYVPYMGIKSWGQITETSWNIPFLFTSHQKIL